MDKKQDITAEKSSIAGTSHLEEAGKPEPGADFREAKLFLGKDRATLTFFLEEEVASIHYDMRRGEIFYRGHNVKNMTMDPRYWLALEKFGDFLAGDPRSVGLRKAYRQCLEHLRMDYGMPA